MILYITVHHASKCPANHCNEHVARRPFDINALGITVLMQISRSLFKQSKISMLIYVAASP